MSSYFVLNLEPLTVETLLIILVTVTLLGGLLVVSYILTHKHQGFDSNFVFTLFMMPIVVSIVVLLVSNNLARAFSLAGVFTLVRFRLAMRDASDLTYILAAVGVGLSLALGYVLLGSIITLFLVITLTLFSWAFIIRENTFEKLVISYDDTKISQETLEEILNDGLRFLKQISINYKPSGSLEVIYKIQLKKEFTNQQLITSIKSIEGLNYLKILQGYKI
jgi:hypothetical protein